MNAKILLKFIQECNLYSAFTASIEAPLFCYVMLTNVLQYSIFHVGLVIMVFGLLCHMSSGYILFQRKMPPS
jgi:hypothetical protein